MKSFTDIEQSKKLAEILPIESADMHWQNIEEDGQLQWFCLPKDFSINQHNTVFAWSLAALLEVLPNPTLTQYRDNKWNISIFDADNHFKQECFAQEPIDACYEMILKLHEHKLL